MTSKMDLLKPLEVSPGFEKIEKILSADSEKVRIERITSNNSSSSKEFWYDQSENEWVTVIQGQGILEFQSPPKEIYLNTGEAIFIPAHTKHRVKSTSSQRHTIWLAIFF